MLIQAAVIHRQHQSPEFLLIYLVRLPSLSMSVMWTRSGDHVRGRDGAVAIVPLTPAAFCLASGSPATAGSKRQCQAPASKHGADCPPTHYRCASARHQHLPSLPRPRPTGAGHKNASSSSPPRRCGTEPAPLEATPHHTNAPPFSRDACMYEELLALAGGPLQRRGRDSLI